MGAVYVVEHINTGGLWALKVMLDCTKLHAERASRFRREARASARITSEHVVRVTDADTAPELDGAPFIVMELLDGEDVERLLSKSQLESREALDILTQVARGLDKAHAAGVIHRDLKPENIFVHRREDGTTIVKVLDFGISKVLRPDGDLASASVTGAADVMGTPLYMAPEQATARHDQVGPATDVWAIGLMAVRMLTGEIYWKGDTIAEVFVQIMSDTRWPPSSRWPALGPGFDAWFSKSCARNVEDRFQSVGEQIAELSALLTGELPLAKSTAPVQPRSDSAPPQLVTQIMSASDRSSARPMSALGVSTAEPVTGAALPLQPSRGLAVGAAVLALAVIGFVGVSMKMRGGDATATSHDSGSGAPAMSATVAGFGTPATGALEPSPAVDAGPPTLTALTSEPTTPTTKNGGPLATPHPGQASQVVPGQGGPRPLQRSPQGPGVATAPSAAPSAVPSAKPAARPEELFNTQK
jgi:serine/threonine-protein kinase